MDHSESDPANSSLVGGMRFVKLSCNAVLVSWKDEELLMKIVNFQIFELADRWREFLLVTAVFSFSSWNRNFLPGLFVGFQTRLWKKRKNPKLIPENPICGICKFMQIQHLFTIFEKNPQESFLNLKLIPENPIYGICKCMQIQNIFTIFEKNPEESFDNPTK